MTQKFASVILYFLNVLPGDNDCPDPLVERGAQPQPCLVRRPRERCHGLLAKLKVLNLLQLPHHAAALIGAALVRVS